MIKVGLTGNFHSGQNQVSEILEKLDVPVFDADLILKYLINYSKPHNQKIDQEFGEYTYRMGLLNTSKFTSNKEWNKLIDLLEFDIIKSYERFRLNHKEKTYTVFKYSYLFERKMNKTMDYTINCHRPKYLRKSDIQLLTYMDSYGVTQLLENEMDETFKNEQSDFTIENYMSIKNEQAMPFLETKVNQIHNVLMKKNPQKNISGIDYDLNLLD